MKEFSKFFIIKDTVNGPIPPGTGVILLTLLIIFYIYTSPHLILLFSIYIPISKII